MVTKEIITKAFTTSQWGATTEASGFYQSGGVTPENSGVAPFLLPALENNELVAGGYKGAKPPVSSLLVSEYKSVTKLKRRKKRCFHRVMSGLERGGCFRVMMLSSGVTEKAVIQRAWRSLVTWGKRRGLLVDYIRVPELTDSGYIHLHVVYRGKFIDRLVLMREWYRLLGGGEYMPGQKYVYLQGLHSKKGIAHYLAKYMAKGNEVAGNYSWSWGWVWRGFVGDWHRLVKAWRCANNGWDEWAGNRQVLSFKWLLDRWRWHLAAGIPP